MTKLASGHFSCDSCGRTYNIGFLASDLGQDICVNCFVGTEDERNVAAVARIERLKEDVLAQYEADLIAEKERHEIALIQADYDEKVGAETERFEKAKAVAATTDAILAENKKNAVALEQFAKDRDEAIVKVKADSATALAAANDKAAKARAAKVAEATKAAEAKKPEPPKPGVATVPPALPPATPPTTTPPAV